MNNTYSKELSDVKYTEKQWIKTNFKKGNFCILMDMITDQEEKTEHEETPFLCKVLFLQVENPVRLWLESLVSYPKIPGWVVDEVTGDNKNILYLTFRDIESFVKHIISLKNVIHLFENSEKVLEPDFLDLSRSLSENSFCSLYIPKKCEKKNCEEVDYEHLLYFEH